MVIITIIVRSHSIYVNLFFQSANRMNPVTAIIFGQFPGNALKVELKYRNVTYNFVKYIKPKTILTSNLP